MPTLKLYVEGLQDDDAERELEARLAAEPGIFGAVASRDNNCLEVDFEDDEIALSDILAIVRAAGYPAELDG